MSGPRLTKPQIKALREAHRSINDGGLVEYRAERSMATYWHGSHSADGTRHDNSAVHFLFTEGLVQRVGVSPNREAFITEEGILQLDAEGELA